jgi:hypothetical protein
VEGERAGVVGHAKDIIRHGNVQALRKAMRNWVMIEDDPGDKYEPRCLIFGTTRAFSRSQINGG